MEMTPGEGSEKLCAEHSPWFSSKNPKTPKTSQSLRKKKQVSHPFLVWGGGEIGQ